jgi:alkyl sulfatase BDS1-like metallo-beta-lactamase superfamily hydrolase
LLRAFVDTEIQSLPAAGAAFAVTGHFTINLITPDNGEKFIIELENATLTNIEGMMGAKTLEAQITEGKCKAEGDVGILKKLAATMVDFDPRFEILPGTKPQTSALAAANPYEAVPGKPIAE